MRTGGLEATVLLALLTLAGSLHPRNAFKGSYDMPALVSACPALQVAVNALSQCSLCAMGRKHCI